MSSWCVISVVLTLDVHDDSRRIPCKADNERISHRRNAAKIANAGAPSKEKTTCEKDQEQSVYNEKI